MDPLTQIIEMIRPTALKWKNIRGFGDWALQFPDDDGFIFGIVTVGSCSITLPSGATTTLSRGDYLLMREPKAWMTSYGTSGEEYKFSSIYVDRMSTVEVGDKNQRETTRVMAGHFDFETANGRLLGDMLEPVVIIRAETGTALRLRMLLEMIDTEAMSTHLGQYAVVQRLLELMLLEAIRIESHMKSVRGMHGLLAAMSDKQLGRAISALHKDVGANWTVSALATEAGLSRSVFAERFRLAVGVGPIEYLQRWRITVAQDQLRHTQKHIDQIALECGYGSASAFSMAFRRIIGTSPRSFRLAKGE